MHKTLNFVSCWQISLLSYLLIIIIFSSLYTQVYITELYICLHLENFKNMFSYTSRFCRSPVSLLRLWFLMWMLVYYNAVIYFVQNTTKYFAWKIAMAKRVFGKETLRQISYFVMQERLMFSSCKESVWKISFFSFEFN